MATEQLQPDSVISSTNLTGATVANLDDDPDSPAGDWATANADNSDTIVHCSFGTPTATLTSGADLQTFKVYCRQSNAGGNTPTVTIALYESGSLVRAGSAVNVTSSTGQLVTFTWNATELAAQSGANVEIHVTGNSQAGSPTARNSVEFDAIEWVADYTAVVNVTETTGSPDALSLTGQAPTVTADVNITTGAPDALVLSGQIPTPTTDANETTGSPDALTFTGQVPTFDNSSDLFETTGPVDVLAFIGQAPTVTSDANETTGSPDALVLTGQAPTVQSDVLETTGAPESVLLTAPGLSLPAALDWGWLVEDLSTPGALATWADNFGIVDLVQAGAVKPTFVENDINGLPAVDFVPTDYMDAAVGTVAQPSTHVVIFDLDTTGTQAITDSTDGANRQNLYVQSGNFFMYAGTQANTGVAAVAGQHVAIAIFDGANSKFYLDGPAPVTVNPGTQSLGTAFRLGSNSGGTFGLDGRVYAASLADVALSQAEVEQVLAFAGRYLNAPKVTSDANVTTGAVDALTFTGHVPTVTADGGADFTDTTGLPDALTLTGQAPTVDAGVVETTGSPDALALSGQAPTFTSDANETTGAVDALAITGYVPTVDTSQSVTETTSGVDALVLSGQTPTVTSDANETTGSPDALSITGQAPNVTSDVLENTGAPDALIVSGQIPTVTTDVNVTTGIPDALVITGIIPTLLMDMLETTGVPDALALTGYVPTVTVDSSIDVNETTGSPDALVFTGYAPSMTVDALPVTGSPDALVITGYVPTVTTDGSFTDTTGAPDALSLSGFAPSVTSDLLETTGIPDALVISGLAPSVVADVAPTSGAPDALVLTGYAPTVDLVTNVLLSTGIPASLLVTGLQPQVTADVQVVTGSPDSWSITGLAPIFSTDPYEPAPSVRTIIVSQLDREIEVDAILREV